MLDSLNHKSPLPAAPYTLLSSTPCPYQRLDLKLHSSFLSRVYFTTRVQLSGEMLLSLFNWNYRLRQFLFLASPQSWSWWRPASVPLMQRRTVEYVFAPRTWLKRKNFSMNESRKDYRATSHHLWRAIITKPSQWRHWSMKRTFNLRDIKKIRQLTFVPDLWIYWINIDMLEEPLDLSATMNWRRKKSWDGN